LAPFYSTSQFLLKSTPELMIETSIMAITVISYITPKRNDVLYSISANNVATSSSKR
jgi:hypothetical protein